MEEIGIKFYKSLSVALFIQHAVRMRHFILSSVAYLDLPYIFAWGISHSEKFQRDVINVYSSSCKVPRFSCQILMTLEFSR